MVLLVLQQAVTTRQAKLMLRPPEQFRTTRSPVATPLPQAPPVLGRAKPRVIAGSFGTKGRCRKEVANDVCVIRPTRQRRRLG